MSAYHVTHRFVFGDGGHGNAGLIQGAENLLHHQLYGFSVLDWFRTYPHNPRVEPQLRLAEEFLLVLIHIVTEMPLPPLSTDDRLRLMLRREVLLDEPQLQSFSWFTTVRS